jgi:hypothetical protein
MHARVGPGPAEQVRYHLFHTVTQRWCSQKDMTTTQRVPAKVQRSPHPSLVVPCRPSLSLVAWPSALRPAGGSTRTRVVGSSAIEYYSTPYTLCQWITTYPCRVLEVCVL